MRFNVYKEAKISLLILAVILTVSMLFYFFASMFTSMGYTALRKAKDASVNDTAITFPTVIIDAGHGGEDPGAVDNGLIEKELNLDVSQSLDAFLSVGGYQTVLTRKDDSLLYYAGQENKKKYYDVRNRAEIANQHQDSIFVSIHMNKFSASYCKGLQTFYSTNNDSSRILAEAVQDNSRLLQTDNKREVKAGNDTAYLLDNLNMPAILVECGFLSNPDEARLLSDNDYRVAIALNIYCGIAEYMGEV